MRIKRGRILKEIFLICTVMVFMFPIIWLIVISLKTDTTIYTEPFALPNPPQWKNYPEALKTISFVNTFKNTAFIAFFAVGAEMIFCIFGAFAIARMRFGSGRLQNCFYSYFVLGMLIPAFVLLFPIYMINAKLNILNTLWAVIIPMWGWMAPVTIMILTAGFKGLPMELDEAAAIDGCGSFLILTRVDLPLLKSSIMTCLILNILGCWNEYPLSSVMLVSEKLMPLSLAAAKFKGLYSYSFANLAAGIVILIIPQLIVFVLFQRQIQEGVVAGALKG